MIQPTRPTLSFARAGALRAVPRTRTSVPLARKMLSAVALPVEEPPTGFDLPILDIFDAPSRLGESSRLLALNAATRRPREARPSPAQRRQDVKPLPAPIVLDGPARPRSMSFVSFRSMRPRLAASRVRCDDPPLAVAPLPNPVVFDGPSRLRPYVRGGSRGNTSSFVKSATPLLLAATAAAVLFGIDVSPEPDRHGASPSVIQPHP